MAVDLTLCGGGHSHVLVLAALVARPEPSLRLSVVSPESRTTYTGMVPGVIGGQYALREAQIDVEMLARRAGGAFVAARTTGVDAARQVLELSDRSHPSYDLLSFDIGSQTQRAADIDAAAPVIGLKPIEPALTALEAALASPPGPGGRRIVVVGAGAGGAEVALALAARVRREPQSSVAICDENPHPVMERGPRTSALVERAFAAAGVRFVGGSAAERVTASAVHLRPVGELAADLIVWATGAGAPPLFRASGLAVDRRGYLLVGGDLRSPAHPAIFGAGDCATLTTHPDLPKAGVYAVRQAPVLAHNLRAAARGAALRTYRPQARFLSLLNTGDGRAILSYGPFAYWGRWAWRLKDWIDRRFVAQFR